MGEKKRKDKKYKKFSYKNLQKSTFSTFVHFVRKSKIRDGNREFLRYRLLDGKR